MLRSLIDRVTLVPEDGLPAMLAFSANRKRSARDGAIWERKLSLVAGACVQFDLLFKAAA